ncbi:MAG: hypothetical protein Q4D16_17150 [Eubacteriales bacterium]|nr:hypothetical protein [Eubacteriales bacterium]
MNAIESAFDIIDIFRKSELPVHATFDGEPYDGQVVKMGALEIGYTAPADAGIAKGEDQNNE